MEEKIILVAVGAFMGFIFPYVANSWDKTKARKRCMSALRSEIGYAKKAIKEKMDWVGRDVSSDKLDTEPVRVVEFEGKKLFLGEPETFSVNCRYWNEKYLDIIGILEPEDFEKFAHTYGLIEEFTIKFKQMKNCFECQLGDKQSMSLMCYNDLINLDKAIKNA